jgi:hypothetical protein
VLQKAQDACKDKLPAGVDPSQVFGRGGNGQGGGRLNQLQPYLTCLRDNGVPVPDVTGGGPQGSTAGNIPPVSPPASGQGAGSGGAGGGGGRGGLFGQIDQSSPQFQAANEKCKVLLPDGVTLPGRGNAGTTTTTKG